MSAKSTALAGAKRQARSKIANGSAFLPEGDGRSKWARLARDTFADLVSHCGGPDVLSATQRMAARRCATTEAELAYLEASFAKAREAGQEPDPAALALYVTIGNAQRRYAEALGWKRAARDITPSLGEYLRTKSADDNATAGKSGKGTPGTTNPIGADERAGDRT